MLQQILPLLPRYASHYYEPFFGSGALFFYLTPSGNRTIISDLNVHLINCYQQIERNPEEIISLLSEYKFTRDDYYRIREAVPSDDISKAARFIYLNRTCWNGLYRVNSRGKFNVPIGRFTNEPKICEADKIRWVSRSLKGVRILNIDFETAISDAVRGDFVYFDPPYISKHENNGFKYYNEKVFCWDDQLRLARVVKQLSEKGVYVMISNASNRSVQNLFCKFNINVVQRNSVISGDIRGRGLVSEIIITNYDKNGEILRGFQ